MVEIIKLGCLQFDEKPVSLGVEYNGESLSFGDTIPEKAISFVKWKNLLVADQCVCTNISWDDLNKAGFIFGCPVKIDGTPYLCRSLKVGGKRGLPNEWDDILDDLGEEASLWHWNRQYFWGQETATYETSYRAVRGYYSARDWHYYYATSRSVRVGFRPVLEPLAPEPLISGSLVGTKLEIYGPGCMFDGKLVDFSDYDLVVESPYQQFIPADCKWARWNGNHIIVDRSAVVWVEEN